MSYCAFRQMDEIQAETIRKISAILKSNGIEKTDAQIKQKWEEYSNEKGAGWLGLAMTEEAVKLQLQNAGMIESK